MAERNYDGTVTMKTRGAMAYTPRASSGIARGPVKAGAPGKLAGSRSTDTRQTRQKGAGYAGRSAWI